MNKLIAYISIPFRSGGFGALLGGATILVVAEFLEAFGGITLGFYGSILGFLIKIGAFCLCFNYSSQVLRASYSGVKTLPPWETPSIDFGELLESLFSILISFIYGFILTSIFYFILVQISNKNINPVFFFAHLPNYDIFVFFAAFFPAIYFLVSIAPDDIADTVNPILMMRIIIKSMPYYLLLVPDAYLLTWLFVYFKISLIFIGSFITWFVKLYFLMLFALIVGKSYAQIESL